MNILAVNSAESDFKSHYSGFIGIAPYSMEMKKAKEGEEQ
jgi:hypothetical protein